MEKQKIRFRCWNCQQWFEVEAGQEERLELTCKRCGLRFEGSAEAFSAHKSPGFTLQTPGKLGANIQNIKIVIEG